jgi:hypothetical protein
MDCVQQELLAEINRLKEDKIRLETRLEMALEQGKGQAQG